MSELVRGLQEVTVMSKTYIRGEGHEYGKYNGRHRQHAHAPKKELSYAELFSLVTDQQTRDGAIANLYDNPKNAYPIACLMAQRFEGEEVRVLQEETPFGYYSEAHLLTGDKKLYKSLTTYGEGPIVSKRRAFASLVEETYAGNHSLPNEQSLTDLYYLCDERRLPRPIIVYENDISATNTLFIASANIERDGQTVMSYPMTGRTKVSAERNAATDLQRRLFRS